MKFSLIIPTHKRTTLLKQCLDSVFSSTYQKKEYEVIVIQDGECKATEKILKQYKKQHSNLQYFLNSPPKGPATARNTGIEKAAGEIIGFTDDDCLLSADWIEKMVAAHQEHPEATVIGGITSPQKNTLPELISQYLSDTAICVDNQKSDEFIFFPTCNVSLKKEIFTTFKFDPQFPFPGGEDLDFFWRVFKNKNNFIWNKNIKILHCRQNNLIKFIKQSYHYGRGNFLVQFIHLDHPSLKDLKTTPLPFVLNTLINLIKLPKFSISLGQAFIQTKTDIGTLKKLRIYSYFALHKISYLSGNIIEFLKIQLKKKNSYSIPQQLILDITHSCNLSCKICAIQKTQAQEPDLPLIYIKKIFKEALELKIKQIALSGGEPLIRPDIFEILKEAQNLKLKNLGILTNGILVKQYITKLTPYLLDNTITPVISLDALSEDIHNLLRSSPDSFKESLESLKLLSNLKQNSPQINFQVITIIFNHNLAEIPQLLSYLKKLNINSLQFQPLLSNNLKLTERKKNEFWIEQKDMPLLQKTLDVLIAEKVKEPSFIKNSITNLALMKKYYQKNITSRDIKCLAASQTMLISNQGQCTTCFLSYGDITKQSLKEILQNKKIRQAEKELKKCLAPCLLPCFCDMQ